ncbi:hypothetical protein MFIFM68171_02302 [Madurella fahalii]|uniref:Uncharacterized protein n=1 Tax=Madurella fahalii TaxID=1157608 RepID=A0ABQ0G2Z5_9PEZI
MAAPLVGIDEVNFSRIRAKAKYQLEIEADQHCDAETMALQIAWLNRRYNPKAFFGLLNAQGLDVTACTVPKVEDTFLFHRNDVDKVWSVAHFSRGRARVMAFDGTSDKPSDRLSKEKTTWRRGCNFSEVLRTQIRGRTFRYGQVHAPKRYELVSLHPAERAILARHEKRDEEYRRILAGPAGDTGEFAGGGQEL